MCIIRTGVDMTNIGNFTWDECQIYENRANEAIISFIPAVCVDYERNDMTCQWIKNDGVPGKVDRIQFHKAICSDKSTHKEKSCFACSNANQEEFPT